MPRKHRQTDQWPAVLRWISRWGPVVVWMAGIFYFSSRPQPLGPLSRSDHSGLIGRVAHIAEYAGLAALLHRALSPQSDRLRASLRAFGLALAYALLDEIHQGFVPGREFSVTDITCDALGALAALGAVWIGRMGWETERPPSSAQSTRGRTP